MHAFGLQCAHTVRVGLAVYMCEGSSVCVMCVGRGGGGGVHVVWCGFVRIVYLLIPSLFK